VTGPPVACPTWRDHERYCMREGIDSRFTTRIWEPRHLNGLRGKVILVITAGAFPAGFMDALLSRESDGLIEIERVSFLPVSSMQSRPRRAEQAPAAYAPGMGITHDMRDQVSTWVALEASWQPGDGLDIGYWVEMRMLTGAGEITMFGITILLVERTYRTVDGAALRGWADFIPSWPLQEDLIRARVREALQQIRQARDVDQERAARVRQRALESKIG